MRVGLLAVVAFLVLLLCVNVAHAGAKKKSKKSPLQRMNAKRSPSGVLKATDTLVSKYLEGVPRRFHMIVFFTSSVPEHKCAICPYLHQVADVLATSSLETSTSNEVLFVVADFATVGKSMFAPMHVDRVPVIVHVAPDQKLEALVADQVYAIQTQEALSIDAIRAWVESRCGVVIKEKALWERIPPQYRALAQQWGLSVGGTLFVAFLLWKVRPSVVLTSPWLWFALVALEVIVVMGGIVFNAIRTPPPYHMDQRTGETKWVYPELRTQFGMEGYMASSLFVVISMAWVALAIMPRKVQSAWKRRLLFWILLSILVVALDALHQMFLIKSPYYPYPARLAKALPWLKEQWLQHATPLLARAGLKL